MVFGGVDDVLTGRAIGAAAYEWVTGRRARAEIRADTARSYRYKLSAFVRFLGSDFPVDRVRRVHVERFLARVGPSSSTKRQHLSVLRRFFAWGLEHKLVRRDPTTGIPMPKEPRRLPRALPIEEVGRALAGAPDARARLVLCLCVQECLRISEVAGLQLGDVDWRHDSLYVRQGKGGKDRRVPLSGETREAVLAYLGSPPIGSGPLIRSYVDARRGISGRYLSRCVGQWMRSAGVRGSAHPLRHSGAQDMADQGAPIRELSEILGHEHLQSTEIYTGRTSLEQMRRAMGTRRYGRDPK